MPFDPADFTLSALELVIIVFRIFVIAKVTKGALDILIFIACILGHILQFSVNIN